MTMSITLRMMKVATAAVDHRGADADQLDHDLAAVAFQHAGRAADVLDREHAGQQGADDTADAVHAEDVERVVVAEHALELGRAPGSRPRRRPGR